MATTNAVIDWIKEIKHTNFVNMDGTNPTAKMVDNARFGGYVGLVWAAMHGIFIHPPSAGMALLSAANKTALFAIMGATFAGTTSALASATGHDRKLNYFIGGCTAGTFLGVRSKSIAVGAQGCVFFGGLAALRKFYDENGWEFR
ncbi:NADH dehydrogenase [ubiquinone] 1 alpha subcomplex subunit 11-like [Amphiura filiformis]|uniref:NADH dehydrogenase [ubiquinone] 1 alpha subcomplex subunit 11-like n=1 Tax=Amphiura filiformis TaxID=82378 RepID=UPI003B219715